jgi:hypothetical protein
MGKKRNLYRVLGEALKERDHLEDLSVEGNNNNNNNNNNNKLYLKSVLC